MASDPMLLGNGGQIPLAILPPPADAGDTGEEGKEGK
jgi:hypothetical protein